MIWMSFKHFSMWYYIFVVLVVHYYTCLHIFFTSFAGRNIGFNRSSHGLVVFDNLFFEIGLKMRSEQQADDMNFSQGSIYYSHVSNSSWLLAYRSYLLTDELATKVSTVELKYAPVQRAVEANIQIKARKDFPCRKGVSSVNGKITVFTLTFQKRLCYLIVNHLSL